MHSSQHDIIASAECEGEPMALQCTSIGIGIGGVWRQLGVGVEGHIHAAVVRVRVHRITAVQAL